MADSSTIRTENGPEQQDGLRGKISRARAAFYGTLATATCSLAPAIAFAADCDNSNMLSTIMGLAVQAVQLFGGGLIVWGGVRFGLAIKDQQGGQAMAESLATIGGGAIVIAAGAFFSSLSFNFNG